MAIRAKHGDIAWSVPQRGHNSVPVAVRFIPPTGRTNLVLDSVLDMFGVPVLASVVRVADVPIKPLAAVDALVPTNSTTSLNLARPAPV